MRPILIAAALLGLTACAHPRAQPPGPCQTWTRQGYITAAMAGRHLTQAQAEAERDAACGAGN